MSKEFMRKYIHVAKAVTPVLTEEAANHIAEEYSRLRSQDQMGSDIARVGWSQNPSIILQTVWYPTVGNIEGRSDCVILCIRSHPARPLR